MTETLRVLAERYHTAGWHPLELPAHQKAPPPEGRTGYGGTDLSTLEVSAALWEGNIATRMPIDVIALDVDVYKGGNTTLKQLLEHCGPLPNTWISHSGRNDGSGIRYYRVPPGLTWVAGLPGIEIIQRNHRYAVLPPSTHPDGRQYGWWNQSEQAPSEDIPQVEDLPELPWAWIAELSRANQDDLNHTVSRAATPERVLQFARAHNEREDAPGYINTIVDHFTDHWRTGYSRHDTMQHCLIWAMECVRADIARADPTVNQLAQIWQHALNGEPRRVEPFTPGRTTEFEAMLRHAVGKVEAKPQAEIDKLHDDIAGIPINTTPPPISDRVDDISDLPPPIDWATFAERDEITRTWLVEQFWPWGRAMALWASAKVGKSELALWCAVKLALGEHPWTGAPIEPVDVAYFDWEMTPDDLEDRLAEFGINHRRLEHLHYWQLAPLHMLDEERGGIEIERLATHYNVQAVIIDTFGRAVLGDENEADTVRAFVRYTGNRLKRLGVGYLRTDHAGKDWAKGQRGSSAKRDDVDVVWSMKRSKTGLVLDCEGSSRLSWVGPSLVIDRIELDGIVSYSTPIRIGWPDGTAEKAAELDALGLPLDVTRRAARAALEAAGKVPGRNQRLDAALKYRCQTGGVQGSPEPTGLF